MATGLIGVHNRGVKRTRAEAAAACSWPKASAVLPAATRCCTTTPRAQTAPKLVVEAENDTARE
jgi:hypothetical protein